MEAVDKAVIRTRLRRERKELPAGEAAERSEKLCGLLKAHERIRKAPQLFLYSAIGREVQLRALAEWALSEEKRIAFPRCEGETMEFYEVKNLAELIHEGSFHILEPEGEISLSPCKGAVILVPGVAFSKEGARIGMGGGYYDRYLQLHPWLYRMGICYSFQLQQGWQAQDCDVPMQEIVTDIGMIYC